MCTPFVGPTPESAEQSSAIPKFFRAALGFPENSLAHRAVLSKPGTGSMSDIAIFRQQSFRDSSHRVISRVLDPPIRSHFAVYVTEVDRGLELHNAPRCEKASCKGLTTMVAA